MILGIGVDLVHLPRIAALVSRRGHERLAKRILSPLELKEYNSRFTTLTDPIEKQQLLYLSSRYIA